MKAATQPMGRTTSGPTHGVTKAVVAVAVAGVIVILALAATMAVGALVLSSSSGTAVERASSDALVQFRKAEREDAYGLSVDEIRRALIEFRQDERAQGLDR